MKEREIIEKFREGMKDGLKSPTLQRADDIIHGERQDQYGNPEMSFEIISDFWNLHNKWRKIRKGDAPYDNEDSAMMLDLMKHARMYGQVWHGDNAVDACGYLAILNDRIKSEG